MNVRAIFLSLMIVLAVCPGAVFPSFQGSIGRQIDVATKNFSKNLTTIFESTTRNQGQTFLSSFEAAAGSLLKGSFSLGATVMKHPRLALLGVGVALYYSPRFRQYAARGVQFCYHFYERYYPRSLLVRTTRTVAEVWRGANPEAVEEAADQAQRERIALQQRFGAAQVSREEQARQMELLTLRIRELEESRDVLRGQLENTRQERSVLSNLGQSVAVLNEQVDSINRNMGVQFDGQGGEPGIVEKIKILINAIKVLQRNNHDLTNRLIPEMLRQHAETTAVFVRQSLGEHDLAIANTLTEHSHSVTEQLAPLQRGVGLLHTRLAEILQRRNNKAELEDIA